MKYNEKVIEESVLLEKEAKLLLYEREKEFPNLAASEDAIARKKKGSGIYVLPNCAKRKKPII